MKIMIEAEVLHERQEKKPLLIIDVRTKDDLDNSGEAAYKAGHIPGAIFLDVKKDVTGEGEFLPEPTAFAEKLGSLGVDENVKIVLYDQGNHRSASKVWVALYYLGHEHVYILNGGYKAWQANQYEVSTKSLSKEPTNYRIHLRQEALVKLAEVKQQLEADSITLIDSRTYERYSGQAEPTYKKAGHIPGALNYETKQTFDQTGKLKGEAALRDHFKGVNQDEKVVVSCGSGNSAAVSMVALKEAGYKDVSLYAGGFSEWIEDNDNEVATEDKK